MAKLCSSWFLIDLLLFDMFNLEDCHYWIVFTTKSKNCKLFYTQKIDTTFYTFFSPLTLNSLITSHSLLTFLVLLHLSALSQGQSPLISTHLTQPILHHCPLTATTLSSLLSHYLGSDNVLGFSIATWLVVSWCLFLEWLVVVQWLVLFWWLSFFPK